MTSSNREGIFMLGRVLLALLLAFGGVGFLPQSQAQAGTPTDNYTIERYYAEDDSEQTTTNTTMVTAIEINFTPPGTGTKDFLIIATALTNNSSTAYYTETHLMIDSTEYSSTRHTPVDASLNWRSFGTHKIHTFTLGSSHNVSIDFNTENAAGTATIKRVKLIIIEVTNYYNAVQETEISTTTTSYVDAGTANLTFTPPAGDYLILVTANLRTGTVDKDAAATWILDGSGSEHEVIQTDPENMSWGTIELENLTATPYTIKIQYHATAPATAYISSARVSAVLLSDLGNFQYAESEAESKTRSTTYVDKTTVSYTPATRHDNLEIVSGLGKQENASYAFYANLDVDGTSEGEYVFVPGTNRIYRSFMMMSKDNIPAGLHTQKIQWRTNNGAKNAEAYIKDANAIDIEINTAESYNDSAHTTVDDFFGAGENTLYIWAHGLRASNTYAVAYYDGDSAGGGQKVATDSGLTSTAYGNLSSEYYLPTDTSAVAGTWHAVVFDTEFGSPSDNYTAATTAPGYTIEDSFEITAAAIPEFPTVFTAIGVAGLCFGIYWWMRKKYQRQVVMA